MTVEANQILHASCVAVDDKALLILGASGQGKSSLALKLMAIGAVLVADDRVLLTRSGDDLWVEAPERLKGFIEARGVGILRADVCDKARIVAVLDLDQKSLERLPRRKSTLILGCALPLLARVDSDFFAPALLQYLKGGLVDPDAQF